MLSINTDEAAGTRETVPGCEKSSAKLAKCNLFLRKRLVFFSEYCPRYAVTVAELKRDVRADVSAESVMAVFNDGNLFLNNTIWQGGYQILASLLERSFERSFHILYPNFAS